MRGHGAAIVIIGAVLVAWGVAAVLGARRDGEGRADERRRR